MSIYELTSIETVLPDNALRRNIEKAIAENGKYIFTRQLPIPANAEVITISTENLTVTVNTRYVNMLDGDYMLEQAIDNMPSENDTTAIVWSEVRRRYVNFVTDYLTSQIRVRYAMFNRPTNGLSNVVIDSFIPRLLVANKMNTTKAFKTSNLPSTAVSISPWFAQMFNTKQMHISQMIRILGYNEKTIKRLLVSVKKARWSISFIGFGGTNVNTAHWITQLAELVHVVKPFYYAEVYENDKTDISNLLRFPINPSAILADKDYPGNKLDIAVPYMNKLSLLKPGISRNYFRLERYSYGMRNFVKTSYVFEDSSTKRHLKVHVLNSDGSYKKTVKHDPNIKNHIYYGAPNIETRAKLSEIGYFISATHASNDCSLHLNPEQDVDLQVESYGMIQLSQFFMNQLRMAIGLLETLANPDFDPSEKNKVLMDYSFDGTSKKVCDRQYNFQMDFDGRMLDEAQAANIGGN